jgi:hypothetical protein
VTFAKGRVGRLTGSWVAVFSVIDSDQQDQKTFEFPLKVRELLMMTRGRGLEDAQIQTRRLLTTHCVDPFCPVMELYIWYHGDVVC